MNNNIIYIDATYSYYRRLWKNDRWKFSGDMVKLSIKEKREGLTAEERYKHDTMNRIVDEHNGNWMEGQETNKPVMRKRQPH